MLGDGLVVDVVFLVNEGDGDGCGSVEHFAVCDALVSVSKDDCLWCDNLGFSRTFCLRILTRTASKKVGAIDDVCDMLGKFILRRSGEEIS